MAAPTQLAYRTLKGVGILDCSPAYEPLAGFERPEGNIRCCAYSPCGRYFAWAWPERVTVIDSSAGSVVTTLPADNVFELGFSPLGTFIITWQRPSKDVNGDATKNLKVWRVARANQDVEEGEGDDYVVGRFVQKSATGWNLQFTQDEKLCARVVTNEVHFYETGDMAKIWSKLRVEGVADMALSSGDDHAVAVFVPERKGLPAAVKVFRVPSFDAPVSQKSFFKGDKVQLKWSNDGNNLIVLAQTEVDKSGKSYYGETTLYLMSAKGAFDSRIDLDKDGPIHDVTWSPNSREFGVVYGYMPAKATLFNTKAIATHTYPLRPRNTIQFSPSARFVLVAGFGNLAGQMDIYDLEKDQTKVCTIEASNASVCEWSPDGKYILTATTSPRLRVDNGVKIWHVSGGLMYSQDLQELYQILWKPARDRQPTDDILSPVPTPHESALKVLGNTKTPSKPLGAYRPPGARGQITPLAFKREDEGGAAYVSNGSLSYGININSFGKSRKKVVPGAEATDEVPIGMRNGMEDEENNLSKAAAKNKKKREAKKAKEGTDKAADVPASTEEEVVGEPTQSAPGKPNLGKAGTIDGSRVQGPKAGLRRPEHRGPDGLQAEQSRVAGPRDQVNSLQGSAKQSSPAEKAGPGPSGASPDSGGAVQDKKVRALLKKLRAIDDLKMRRAGGEKLEGTQIRKMDTEDAVRKELESLGWSE